MRLCHVALAFRETRPLPRTFATARGLNMDKLTAGEGFINVRSFRASSEDALRCSGRLMHRGPLRRSGRTCLTLLDSTTRCSVITLSGRENGPLLQKKDRRVPPT